MRNHIVASALFVALMLLLTSVCADVNDSVDKLKPQQKLQDAQIANAVNAALADYASSLSVSVNRQVVYLAGELASGRDYTKVIMLAQSVDGVNGVNVDRLVVRNSHQPLHDLLLLGSVRGRLMQAGLLDKNVSSWTMQVVGQSGKLTLTGRVMDAAQKKQIIDLVKQVQGVERVDDKLIVLSPGNSVQPSNLN